MIALILSIIAIVVAVISVLIVGGASVAISARIDRLERNGLPRRSKPDRREI